MSDPRYSIIPAGAVCDPRLEGRDLQVLCFLGKHTNKLGWCFLNQSEIAKQIDCGRSTVQRSIARLNDAGYVQIKFAKSSSSRPHACHAYRTIMDRDDPQVGPSELEVEAQEHDARCPPVGTSTGEVPASGHLGAHVCMGTERPSKILDGGGDAGARARESLVKPEAWKLATEIAAIAGHPDPQSWPPGWCGAPMRVQGMLDHGWQPEIMLASARAVMARKTGDPPSSINYFEKPFASAHAQNAKPFPVVTEGRNTDGQSRKGGLADALARLKSTFTGGVEGRGSEADRIQQGGLGAARLIEDGRSERS